LKLIELDDDGLISASDSFGLEKALEFSDLTKNEEIEIFE